MLDKPTVLSRPYEAMAIVAGVLPQVTGAVIAVADGRRLVVDLRLSAPLELAAHDYPIEPVRLLVVEDLAVVEPLAFPLREGLTWLHRNPTGAGDQCGGSLCLWYPGDPDHLRWSWQDGFEAFVALVHRHLLAEERCRRGHGWPWEDAPHGERSDSRPHPRSGRRTNR